MSDELETILRLVRDGHLTPEEAAPIIDALTRGPDAPPPGQRPFDDLRTDLRDAIRRGTDEVRAGALQSGRTLGQSLRGRHLRIRVTERGRQVVNLRIPLAFADAALRAVPGIGNERAAEIREAIDAGTIGPVIDVEDEDGDGVLITVE